VAVIMTLTGCCTKPSAVPDYGHPAQTGYLYLEAGKPIPTLDRKTYLPLQNEKWVNPEVLRDKDNALLLLKAALEKQQVINSELIGILREHGIPYAK
jgi:hypothetical protein